MQRKLSGKSLPDYGSLPDVDKNNVINDGIVINNITKGPYLYDVHTERGSGYPILYVESLGCEAKQSHKKIVDIV